MEERPIPFMFIDSSNGGVNAKPDKAVKSFVMNTARSRAPWTPKPITPDKVGATRSRMQRRPPPGKQHCIEQQQSTAHSSASTPVVGRLPEENYTAASRCSTGNISVLSDYHSELIPESPFPKYTNPQEVHGCPEDRDVHDIAQTELDHQLNINIAQRSHFDCLAVHLDEYSGHLLHKCRLGLLRV